MKRCLVIGSGGAGKSTLAREMARRTGLPLIHLDQHYWRPGWVPAPPDAWRTRVEELIQRPTWIMDGNYGSTLEPRLAAADTVVFLDTPRLVCIGRVLRRWWRHRGRARWTAVLFVA